MWSLYLRPSFAEEAGCLIVRNRIGGEWVFDFPVPGPDGGVDAALTAIESYCTDTETPLVISVVPEEKAPELLLRWPRLRMNNERNWKDYLYRAEDMAAFAGRKYSGQRNHINKFRKEYPDAKFVPLTGRTCPSSRISGRIMSRSSRKPASTPSGSWPMPSSGPAAAGGVAAGRRPAGG